MLDFYIGQAGISPDQFWRNTWKENALLGESWSVNVNLNWEMARYISTMIVNSKSTPEQFKAFLDQIEKSQSK